jgi:cytochrome c
MKKLALVCVAIAVIAGAWFLFQPKGQSLSAAQTSPLADRAMVAVVVPAQFTEQEQMGERAYEAKCAACHGANGQGQDGVAPPFVHRIYEPNHHGDMAFVLATQNGVRAHHWSFGDMPAVEGVTVSDVSNIVAYVRALQRENGIN